MAVQPGVTKAFPRELAELAAAIARWAREEGLDFYETVFELVDFETMNQIAAYGGLPQRYPHWRFGMEYERLRKQQRYGLSRVYEMVVNNDPCYAYLLSDNSVVDHKMVMAHVYAHGDFFKNNIWFAHTNRKMMDEVANHATRIRRHIDREGFAVVEEFVDRCLCLENLIDPLSAFVRRGPAEGEGPEDEADVEAEVVRYPAKRYMERYINPPQAIEAQRQRLRQERKRKKKLVPAAPVRDALSFLLAHAPLEDWQADILSIIREEAYYYAPQRQSKIMNEGWATYWHSVLMTRYGLRDEELITYCDHHAGTLATGAGQLNPYKLGMELFRDIEQRWDRGRYGKEYEECTDLEKRRNWGEDRAVDGRVVGRGSRGREKIFEVRRIYNDVTFMDEFLTPDFVEQQRLYQYRHDAGSGRMVAVNRDFESVKQQLLFALTNLGEPYIYVVDGNYGNRGDLYLAHKHIGADLEVESAGETLGRIQRIWQRPVHLQAQINGEMMLFTHDGEKARQQKISEDLPEPAHQV